MGIKKNHNKRLPTNVARQKMSNYKRLYLARNSDSHKPWTYRDKRTMESAMYSMHQESYAAHCARNGVKYIPERVVADAKAVYDGLSEARREMSTFDEYVSLSMHLVMYQTEKMMDVTAWVKTKAGILAVMEPLEIPASKALPSCGRVGEVCYYALSRRCGRWDIDPERIVSDDI